jgi:tetratricopeptide (TPR) repeat protein
MGGAFLHTAAIAAVFLIAGCTGPQTRLSEHLPEASAPSAVELRHTPFFPQRDYQCGPAALATVLVASGVEVSADALVEQVYLPARRGSLQAEMTAAMRRHGRLAYRLEPTLAALLAELRGGRPVVVLLNLGLDLIPVWHYAVVIGYDTAADAIILRSGTQRRREMAAGRFLQSWRRADSWALLALEPGALPAADSQQRYLQAAAGLEHVGAFDAARASYAAALQRWPDQPTALLGLANSQYALARYDGAEASLRRLLAVRPDHVAGWNNLASVLLAQGCTEPARQAIERAAALAGDTAAHADVLAATRDEIAAASRAADRAPARSCGGLP